jgi:hypothetical protein
LEELMSTSSVSATEVWEQRTLRLVPGTGEQLSLPYEYEVAPGVPAIPPVTIATVPTPPPFDGLPDPRVWTERLARACAEVAIGIRPPGQLKLHVEREELARLTRRGQAVLRHPSARAQQNVARIRKVSGVRACVVAPGVVETSAVLLGGERARAIALRLEARDGRWLATVVDLG